MQSLVYIDLVEKPAYSYEKEIINLIKSKLSSIISFDIDFQSDSYLLESAIRLMKESEKCILIIESESKHASKISPFAELIIEHPAKYFVLLNGENEWLTKLCSGIGTNYLNLNLNLEEQAKKSIEFLT